MRSWCMFFWLPFHALHMRVIQFKQNIGKYFYVTFNEQVKFDRGDFWVTSCGTKPATCHIVWLL